jgi:hypothetical protein
MIEWIRPGPMVPKLTVAHQLDRCLIPTAWACVVAVWQPFTMTHSSQHHWTHDGVEYEANNYHYSDADAWCYELYALPGVPGRNDYIEFRIPDLTPNGGPYTPASAEQVTFLAHGEPRIPWPILMRLIGLMREYGDLVDDEGPKA